MMNGRQELVSIVVPVYNVEAYLRKCVDSIVNQSYENLEIILVDDGSMDDCSRICDEYAMKDRRIRVVHKINGGLSSARNAGLDISTGQYVLFVDSDDYVASDMVDFLYAKLTNGSVGMSTCRFDSVLHGQDVDVDINENVERTLSSSDALSGMLYGKNATLHSWAKLYRKSLFNTIRFPEGRLYEDAGTTYKLVMLAGFVSINSARKYYYLQRGGSITKSKFSRRMMDSVDFAEEILEYATRECPVIVPAARSYLFSSATYMASAIYVSGGTSVFKEDLARCSTIISEQGPTVSKDDNTSGRNRLYAKLSMFSPYVLPIFVIQWSNAKKLHQKINNALSCRRV